MGSYAHVLEILAFFGSFWLTVIVITATALTYRYWRQKQVIDQGREIVVAMLHNKMTADDIERVLVAWSGNRTLAKKVLNQINSAQVAHDPKLAVSAR